MTDDGDEPADAGPTPDGTARTGEGDVPLSDLAADVNERRDRDEPDLFEEVFSEQQFEEVEQGAIWQSTDEDGGSEFGAVGEVIEEGEQTYVVSKRNFCERCRYFSEPPEVHCNHDGTEIREFVDKDHVRLYSCPIVEERGLAGEPPIG